MKKVIVLLFMSLVFLCTPFVYASNQEKPTVRRILEYYKRRDYKEITNIASDYIRNSEDLSQDDKVVKFYFHTENDLKKLDEILDRIYKNTDRVNSRFHYLNYLLIEKALLGAQYELGVKWGEIYRKEAKSKRQRYFKGLYLYASILYKADRSNVSLSVIDSALRERPSKTVREKFKLLRISQLKNDFQIIVESKNFLKNNYDSKYADFIFAQMIQAYKNAGKKKRVEQLKVEFKKDFSDSLLLKKVLGI